MEELSSTERLIVAYIKSHPPEDCMKYPKKIEIKS